MIKSVFGWRMAKTYPTQRLLGFEEKTWEKSAGGTFGKQNSSRIKLLCCKEIFSWNQCQSCLYSHQKISTFEKTAKLKKISTFEKKIPAKPPPPTIFFDDGVGNFIFRTLLEYPNSHIFDLQRKGLYSAKDNQWAARCPNASPKTHWTGCDVGVENLMTTTGRILSPPPNFEKYVRYETLQGIIGSRMKFVAWWHVSRIFKSLGSNVSCCSNKICGGKNYGLTQKLRGLCCICLTRNSSTDTFSLRLTQNTHNHWKGDNYLSLTLQGKKSF